MAEFVVVLVVVPDLPLVVQSLFDRSRRLGGSMCVGGLVGNRDIDTYSLDVRLDKTEI